MTFSTIMFLCDDPSDLGGVQRVLATLAHELRRNGCRVVVASLLQRSNNGFLDPAIERVQLFEEGPLTRFLQRIGVGPLHLRGRRLLRLRKLAQLRARRILRQQVSYLQPDAVIAFDSLTAKIATETRLVGTKVLIQYHNSFASLEPTADFGRLRRASQSASAFLALTEQDAVSFSQAGFARTDHVSNPVPFYPTSLPAARDHKIVALGRYHHQKAFDQLIAAWAMVPRKGHWHLDIYGEGPDYRLMLKAVDTGGVADSVTIHPPTWDAQAVLTNSAIYALSSRFEGLPMVVVEAMACAIPVVSTRCGPGPEGLVTSCGLLADIGDASAFAVHLQTLIDDPNLRAQLGKAGRAKAQDYRVDIIVRRWVELVATCPFVEAISDA